MVLPYVVDRCNAQRATPALTPREIEVMTYVARGFSNDRIARTLNISRHTVINHLRHIMDKTTSHNRTEAVYRARALGIID
jgi:DNA-binding CsgD family transcriptional regulator